MAVSRFPCRSCGQPTEGEDAYVVCSGLPRELEAEARHDALRRAADDDVVATPLAPHEVEAQLRKLLGTTGRVQGPKPGPASQSALRRR